mgnify:CR=1 FL=1
MTKKVQLMTNAKKWQTVDGVEVLVDNVPQEDLDPITDSSCVEIEGHRTLEETISQDNMFTPEIVETKVHSKVGGVYHDNVVDGAYEEAILYGNTQVNLVESMTSGTKYIPHSFTSFQGNESKIGNYHNGRTNQVAPLVKGVTMVNLVPQGNMTLKGGAALSVYNIKGDTEYTLKFTFTQKNNMAGIVIQSFKDENGTLTYLENSKLQSGLGDEVAITFTAHEQANRVHICNGNEYGGETIQLDNIMVIEGDVTDLDLPFFKGMRSVELSRPLTNLFTDDLQIYKSNVTSTINNGNITVTSTGIATWAALNIYFKDTLKPHTQYLVMWDSLSYNHTGSALATIAVYDDNGKGISEINKPSTQCPTLRSLVFDTKDYDVNYIKLRIHATTTNSETGTTTVTGLRVFEWDDSLRTLDLQTIGYFSGTKYVSARALETEGKNLYPYGDINFTSEFASSWCDSKGNAYMAGDIASKSQARFLLRKGTYYLSNGSNSNVAAIQLVDDKENLLISPFTLTQDTYCTIRVKTREANVATTVTNIQIERGETATTYEAYQGRYYKPRETEEIILRSLPNGVCDTFNLQTGELVQNIGEVVLDGDENIKIVSSVSNDTHTYFDFDSVFVGALNGGDLVCDSFAHIDYIYGSAQTVEGINIGNLYWGSIRILNSRLSSVDVTGFKTWLQENPVTVQYELAEPIITKLQTYARVYSGQTNARTNMGNNLSALTYYSSNYYLKVSNLSPVPAILEPITSIPYDVRLKPSTLYTVKYSRGGYSNSMKFDLGGSVVEKTNVATSTTGIAEELTVRTPAILSHEQLILSGTGYAHNFIVVEGDITGTELPYFEGMKDVKMPIVKNIGKNLFHGGFELGTMSSATGEYTDVTTAIRATDYTKVIGGKQYVFYCDDLYYKFAYVQYDKNKKFLRTSGGYVSGAVITLQPDVEYVIMRTPDGQSPLMNNTHVKLALYEYEEGMDTTLQDYKENSVYAVQGEYPITSEMIEQGGFSTSLGSTYEDTKYDNAARLRSKDLIPVKPNTTYAFAHSFSKFAYNVYQWNGNKKFIDGASQYFASGQIETITTTADTQYIHFLMSKYDASQVITVAEYDWNNFHMYELDSTINLRSLPNGVKDELNLLTGEYIQRVGEIVLDNTETWSMDTTETAIQPNTNIFYTGVHSDFKPLVTADRAGSLVCDKVDVVPDLYFIDKVGIMSNTDPRIYVRVPKTDAPDVATFTTYIQNNPLTLQYELAEPIISHVRLVSNNQEREVGVKLPNGVCNTYNPSTGITTVRVGKMVLDGSENWKEDTAATKPTDLIRFAVKISGMRKGRPYNTGDFVYESNISYNIVNNDIISPRKLPNIWNYYENNIYMDFSPTAIGMTTSDTTETKLSKFKTYLASNPVTVWYELNYPQIQPDIVLPNGVHDEYNPETGVYTKKVGFTEFDGSADEGWRAAQTDPSRFVCETLTDRKYYSSDVIKDCMLCDKVTVVSYKELFGTNGTDGAYGIAPYGANVNIQMRLEGITTAEQLQQYLSQNPLKVWYELATPITYQLTPYFGLPQPYAYEDGYLIHDSAYGETTLPPEFKYKLVANRTGQIVQNGRKLQEHTTRLSNLEALIIEATIESLFNRELQLFELELMDIQLIDLGE